VGLVCRLLEERGIATTYVATGRDLASLVNPPRCLFVNHPMGNNFGAPGDRSMQMEILRTALSLIYTVGEGGTMVEYPTNWETPFRFLPAGRRAG
jgi:hypothetical protein|tara:strand:+ start:463 stop:747 length:285 start_codon:yes stop_codon:yes gene_type:complete